MKHPLLLAALCATGAVAVLSGVAIAAFATPATPQTSTVRGVAPLIVPLDHHPTGFARSPMTTAAGEGILVVVAVPGAQPVEDAYEAHHPSAQPGPASATPSRTESDADFSDVPSSGSVKPDDAVSPSAGSASSPSSEAGKGTSAEPAKVEKTPKPAKVEKAPKPAKVEKAPKSPSGEPVTGRGATAPAVGVATDSKPAKPGK
ncbi:hypothetical protein [Lacisediminihabitans sp. H27-G8]|uniref:hypothetical protein n=1 Tax=Lacisediminihabitans sp. H27-G8 TaxID=3111909 RepID=UPI0038FD3D8D